MKHGAFCYRHGTSCPGTTASPGRTDTLNRSIETRRPTINEVTEDEIGQYFDLSDPEPEPAEIEARIDQLREQKRAADKQAMERLRVEREKFRPRAVGAGDPELESDTQAVIREVCDGLRDFLLDKNAQYGDSAIDPVRIFSKASPIEQLLVRIDDKLSRIEKGDERIESDDDVIDDLIGYFILLKVAKIKGRS